MESPTLTRLAGNFVDLMAGMGLRPEDMAAVARLMERHAALQNAPDAPGRDDLPLFVHAGPPMN